MSEWLFAFGPGLLVGSDNLICLFFGNLFVVGEQRSIDAASLRHGTKDRRVLVDLSQRHIGLDDLEMTVGFHTEDLAAPSGNISHHIAHVLIRHSDGNLVDRFEQYGTAFDESLFESHGAGHPEGMLVGVDGMIRAVEDRDAHIDHFIAGNDAALHTVDDPFFHGRYKTAGDNASDDGIDEFESGPSRERFQLQPNVAKLTPTAGLLLMFVLHLGNNAAKRLFVRNLGFSQFHVDSVLLFEPLRNDEQMEFPLTGNDRLTQLAVDAHDKGRILFVQRMEPGRHLVFVSLGL